MDLRQLGYVVAIAEEGGFTAAADRAGISQPSLSYAVKALENELGAVLFHRLGRSVRPTAAGEALLGPARQALRDADVARAAVAAVAGLQAGRLDLVCLPTLAVDPVAGLVGRFRVAHPGVQVRIDEPEDLDAVAEAVRSGTSELGITELLPGADLGGLDSIELDAHEFVAVVPPDLAAHLDTTPTLTSGADDGGRRGRALSLQVLARLPLVTTPPGTSTRRQIDEAFGAAGLEATLAVETDHRESIIAMVLAGAGVSIVPAPLAASSRLGDAVVRPLSPRIERKIGLVRRAGPLSPAAQALVSLAIPDAPARPPRPRARRRRPSAPAPVPPPGPTTRRGGRRR
jgi:DNA-binding transcriptional LysR family regulator